MSSPQSNTSASNSVSHQNEMDTSDTPKANSDLPSMVSHFVSAKKELEYTLRPEQYDEGLARKLGGKWYQKTLEGGVKDGKDAGGKA